MQDKTITIIIARRARHMLVASALTCPHAKDCPQLARGLCIAADRKAIDSCPHSVWRKLDQLRPDEVSATFCNRIRAMPKYDAITRGPDRLFCVIGGKMAHMRCTFVGLDDPNAKTPRVTTSSWGNERAINIPLERLTPELLNAVLSTVPRDDACRPIREYAHKIVPRILSEMADEWPEGHAALVKAYPRWADAASPVGRRAYLATCAQGATFHANDATWVLEGDELVSHDLRHLPLPYDMSLRVDAGDAVARVRVPAEATVRVTDASQACKTTRFV